MADGLVSVSRRIGASAERLFALLAAVPPEDLRKAVRDGEGWRDAMTASLARLALLPAVRTGGSDRRYL